MKDNNDLPIVSDEDLDTANGGNFLWQAAKFVGQNILWEGTKKVASWASKPEEVKQTFREISDNENRGRTSPSQPFQAGRGK